MSGHYQSEQEIKAVVAGFESCDLNIDSFKHLEHLTVAVWYLRNTTPEEAFKKMCSGILRLIDHYGVSSEGFSVELTQSWINLIQRTMDQMDPKLSLLEVTNRILELLKDKRAVFSDADKT